MTRFNRIITEMCKYYSMQGMTIEKQASLIGVSLRTLQNWKSRDVRPYKDSMEKLFKFLEENNGKQFIVSLRDNPIAVDYIESSERGIFPDWIDAESIKEIRDNFPKASSFKYLCLLTYCERMEAIKKMIPGDPPEYFKVAALQARYDSDMNRSRDMFGIDGIYEWKDRIIQYITGDFRTDGDIEALGQEALDKLIEAYIKKKNRRNQIKKAGEQNECNDYKETEDAVSWERTA